jgi:single-strand DNA-binding protein
MSHTITSKLNNDARSHAGQSGTTFFVSVGEKNFNFKTKQNEYTNYEAALFAKDAQIPFYQKALVKGAIIEVKGSGILLELDPTGQYPPKLALQDAKLGFVNDELADKQGQQAPQGYQQPQQGHQQQAPQHPPYGQAPQQPAHQVPYGQSPQQAPQGYQQNPK